MLSAAGQAALAQAETGPLDNDTGTFFGDSVAQIRTDWKNEPKYTIPNGQRFSKHGLGTKSASEGLYVYKPDFFGGKNPASGNATGASHQIGNGVRWGCSDHPEAASKAPFISAKSIESECFGRASKGPAYYKPRYMHTQPSVKVGGVIGSSARSTQGMPGDPSMNVAPGQYDHTKAMRLLPKQPCATIPRARYPPTQFVSNSHSDEKMGTHSPGPIYAPNTALTKQRSAGHAINGKKKFNGKVKEQTKQAKLFVAQMLVPSRSVPGRSLGLDCMQDIVKDERGIKI
jgi:hypothetical protein